MASFQSTVITERGHNLMAKITSGTTKMSFTKIRTSDSTPSDTSLPTLTALSSIKQTVDISGITVINPATVKVSGAISNAGLGTGYFVRVIGLYAQDPDLGEILYSVTKAVEADWMPPNNGISSSSLMINLLTVTSNASNVTINVDPAAVATISDIQELQKEISNLQAYIGYTDEDIYGVEVDFENNTFTRLAGAVGKEAGTAFNTINAFGGRRRCALDFSGNVVKYYGEEGYAEGGTIGTTKVNIMVEQPKFYYKVVPIKLEKVSDTPGEGYHIKKAAYYISDTPKVGFKVHPAFLSNSEENDKIYLSAFEGGLRLSNGSIVLDDDMTIEPDNINHLLGSTACVLPIGSVSTNTISTGRKLAQHIGNGWQQQLIQTSAATQLLFLIEYASFNIQSCLGIGCVKINGTFQVTGSTSILGNLSGAVTNSDDYNIVSYRGEENFFGNNWKWLDGINIKHTMDPYENAAYIADYGYAESKYTDNYKKVALKLRTNIGSANYIKFFGIDKDFAYDWLFLPSEIGGSSELPVGDGLYNNDTSTDTAFKIGGKHTSYNLSGLFYYHIGAPSAGGMNSRLTFIPSQVS